MYNYVLQVHPSLIFLSLSALLCSVGVLFQRWWYFTRVNRESETSDEENPLNQPLIITTVDDCLSTICMSRHNQHNLHAHSHIDLYIDHDVQYTIY